MTKKRIQLEDRSILKDDRSVEQFAMDNCKVLGNAVAERAEIHTCKTCNKQFPSFQALGGHRASHKLRLLREKDEKVLGVRAATSSWSRKMYRCTICGLEYSVGQALGGHMNRHRLGGRKAALAAGEDSGTSENSINRVTWDLNLTPDENRLIDSKAAVIS